MRILIGGGVRSGKSELALSRARTLGVRRVYVATAEPGDPEMGVRIERHVRDRGTDFRTVEAPVDLVGAIHALENVDSVVVDCVTFWMANLLLRDRAEEEILSEVRRLVSALREKPFHAILVTNEVGMGVVPETALGRTFRDVCGRAHQVLAREADEIYFGVLGMMMRLRPEPVAVL